MQSSDLACFRHCRVEPLLCPLLFIASFVPVSHILLALGRDRPRHRFFQCFRFSSICSAFFGHTDRLEPAVLLVLYTIRLCNFIVFCQILIFHNDRAPQRVCLCHVLRTHGVTSTNTSRRSCWSCFRMSKVASQKSCVTPVHSQNREPWNLFLTCLRDQNCV